MGREIDYIPGRGAPPQTVHEFVHRLGALGLTCRDTPPEVYGEIAAVWVAFDDYRSGLGFAIRDGVAYHGVVDLDAADAGALMEGIDRVFAESDWARIEDGDRAASAPPVTPVPPPP